LAHAHAHTHTHTHKKSQQGLLETYSADVVAQIQNNGRAFTEEDWTRIRKIAEGNPNSDACGMFGVGFYSVFAICEQPIIKSGTASVPHIPQTLARLLACLTCVCVCVCVCV
jgi:HSP90 family molecular chaperone